MGTDAVAAFLPWIGLAVLAAWAGAVALGDIQFFRIRDRLNLAGAAGFLVLALPMGMSLFGFGAHVATGLVVAALAMGAFAIGWFGGGDAKMIAAASLWLGPIALGPFVVVTALAGGLLALVLLVSRKVARHTGLPRGPRWLRQILRRGSGVPYGVALAVGLLCAAPYAAWYPKTAPALVTF
jgi:prepilin peptidase CpaA